MSKKKSKNIKLRIRAMINKGLEQYSHKQLMEKNKKELCSIIITQTQRYKELRERYMDILVRAAYLERVNKKKNHNEENIQDFADFMQNIIKKDLGSLISSYIESRLKEEYMVEDGNNE